MIYEVPRFPCAHSPSISHELLYNIIGCIIEDNMYEAIIFIMVIMSHLVMSFDTNMGCIIATHEWRVQCADFLFKYY